jgi:hypothetical protein
MRGHRHDDILQAQVTEVLPDSHPPQPTHPRMFSGRGSIASGNRIPNHIVCALSHCTGNIVCASENKMLSVPGEPLRCASEQRGLHELLASLLAPRSSANVSNVEDR